MDTLLVLNDTIATKINAVVLQMSPCTEKAEKTLHEVAETNHWDFLIVLSICIMIAYIFWICSKRSIGKRGVKEINPSPPCPFPKSLATLRLFGNPW